MSNTPSPLENRSLRQPGAARAPGRVGPALPVVVAVAIALLAPAGAFANTSDLQLQIRETVPIDSQPGIRLQARRDIKEVVVSLTRTEDRKKFSLRATMAAGETRDLTWSQPPGKMRYYGEANVEYKIGPPSKILLEFQVTVVDRLKVWVAKNGFSLLESWVRFFATRPLVRASVEVIGRNGDVLREVNTPLGLSDTQGTYRVRWKAVEGDVGKVTLKAYDRSGFWSRLDVIPFSIFIPHDEVVFPSGSAKVRSTETGKLDATLALIQEAIRRNAQIDGLRLYIAGYTDTVSSRKYNLGLSRRRARAIGRYFRRKGLKIPIYHQGFGEEVLAVGTPDNTDEPRNRRAIYLLSNHTPAISKHFPRADWSAIGGKRRRRRKRRRRSRRRRRK